MPEYRLLRGTHRRENGERAESGDVIELTEAERDRLPSGKLERVDDDDDEEETPDAPELSQDATVEDESETDDTASVETADEPVMTDESETVDAESDEDDASELDGLDVPDDEPHAELLEQQDGASEAEATGEVPDDYTLLSKMGKLYEGDEVHGSLSGDELKDFFNGLSDTEVAHLKDEAKSELA